MPAGLTGIVTQGRHDAAQWVEKYTVGYGMKASMIKLLNGVYNWLVYTANSDQNTRVKNALPDGLVATRLRIYPVQWHNYPSMRAEVVTCAAKGTPCWAGASEGS